MLFFDAKASLRHPAVLLVEPVAIFLSIVLYIWWLRFEHPSFAFVILAIVVLSHIWHGEAPHDLGFRRENFAACLAIFWPALLFTVLTLLSFGILLQTMRETDLERAVVGFFSYCVWGLFQQYLLNGYFVNRLAAASSSARGTAMMAGTMFAGAHTPNWFLMIVAFAAGYCCARVYLRFRNLYFLGLAHGTIGSLLFLVVPDWVSHHLCVGPGWFGH